MRTAATVLRLNEVTGEPRETETLMRGSERGRQKSPSTQLITRWRPTLPHGDGVLVVPNAEGCHGRTQTDGTVCRWLADHRTGNPVRGRAGEGEQVAR